MMKYILKHHRNNSIYYCMFVFFKIMYTYSIHIYIHFMWKHINISKITNDITIIETNIEQFRKIYAELFYFTMILKNPLKIIIFLNVNYIFLLFYIFN